MCKLEKYHRAIDSYVQSRIQSAFSFSFYIFVFNLAASEACFAVLKACLLILKAFFGCFICIHLVQIYCLFLHNPFSSKYIFSVFCVK